MAGYQPKRSMPPLPRLPARFEGCCPVRRIAYPARYTLRPRSVPRGAPLARTSGVIDAGHQVLPHRQAGNDIAMLRNVAEAQIRDPVARQSRDVAALDPHRALRRHFAHDRLDGGGAADAIAPEQAHDL